MAKKSKALLPKRIGRVKVGKSIRKGALADVLASKAGQALIAQAVLAVGAIATERLRKSRKLEGVAAAAKGNGRKAGQEGSAASATLTYALGEAVRSFSEALHRGPAERASSSVAGGWTPLAPSHTRKAAKARRPRAEPSASPPT